MYGSSADRDTGTPSTPVRNALAELWGTLKVGGAFVIVAAIALAVVQATPAPPDALAGATDEHDDDPPTPPSGGFETVETTEPSTATATETRTAVNRSRVERAMHERVNQIRVARGLDPLDRSDGLAHVAGSHAEAMAEDRDLQYSDTEIRIALSAASCRTFDENVAYRGRSWGYDNETKLGYSFVGMWMDYPWHRENILRPSFTRVGYGIVVTEREGLIEVYVAQMFCD